MSFAAESGATTSGAQATLVEKHKQHATPTRTASHRYLHSGHESDSDASPAPRASPDAQELMGAELLQDRTSGCSGSAPQQPLVPMDSTGTTLRKLVTCGEDAQVVVLASHAELSGKKPGPASGRSSSSQANEEQLSGPTSMTVGSSGRRSAGQLGPVGSQASELVMALQRACSANPQPAAGTLQQQEAQQPGSSHASSRAANADTTQGSSHTDAPAASPRTKARHARNLLCRIGSKVKQWRQGHNHPPLGSSSPFTSGSSQRRSIGSQPSDSCLASSEPNSGNTSKGCGASSGAEDGGTPFTSGSSTGIPAIPGFMVQAAAQALLRPKQGVSSSEAFHSEPNSRGSTGLPGSSDQPHVSVWKGWLGKAWPRPSSDGHEEAVNANKGVGKDKFSRPSSSDAQTPPSSKLPPLLPQPSSASPPHPGIKDLLPRRLRRGSSQGGAASANTGIMWSGSSGPMLAGNSKGPPSSRSEGGVGPRGKAEQQRRQRVDKLLAGVGDDGPPMPSPRAQLEQEMDTLEAAQIKGGATQGHGRPSGQGLHRGGSGGSREGAELGGSGADAPKASVPPSLSPESRRMRKQMRGLMKIGSFAPT